MGLFLGFLLAAKLTNGLIGRLFGQLFLNQKILGITSWDFLDFPLLALAFDIC